MERKVAMSRVLPPNPHIDHLKNEAKSLLKAHRGGDVSCCKTLCLLRRFHDAADDRILAADVSLQEAQFALALDYGFKNWDDLARHVADVASWSDEKEPARAGAFLLKDVPAGGDGVNRFISGFRMCLEHCGAPCDHDTMMGDSGMAFIIQADSAHTAWGKAVKQLDIGWWPLDSWGALLRAEFLGTVAGRELRVLPFSDAEYKTDAKACYERRFHGPIVECLRKGLPAVAVEVDVQLVCGYDDGQPPLLGQVACLPGHKIARLGSYPWRVVVPGEAMKPLDRGRADIEALRFAVKLASDGLGKLAPPNKLSGKGAFALWARLLRDPEGWGAHFYHANVVGHLEQHRAAAVRYLRAMSQRQSSSATGILNEAADFYASVLEVLKTADTGKQTLSTAEGRERLATVVERVAAEEVAAAERMEAALNEMR